MSSDSEHDFFGDDLNGPSHIQLAPSEVRFRVSWWTAKQIIETLICHGRPAKKIEKSQIQLERSIFLYIYEILVDPRHICGFSIRSKAHQFVLARIHTEAAEIRKRRIEKTNRIRKVDLLLQVYSITSTHPDTARSPLSNPVECKNRCRVERRGEKGARRMALVMFSEPKLFRHHESQFSKLLLDQNWNPELLAKPDWHRSIEGPRPVDANLQI